MSLIRNKADLPNVTYKVDKKYKPFLKHLDIGEINDVPVRKNCLTGSGKTGMCHWNVASLNKKYGGRSVLGYFIFYSPKAFLQDDVAQLNKADGLKRNGYQMLNLIVHTCWETPEGNLVDVTYGSQNDYMKRLKLNDTILFAPMLSFDGRKENAIPMFNFSLKRNYLKTRAFQINTASKNLIVNPNYPSDDEVQAQNLLVGFDSKNKFDDSFVIKRIAEHNEGGKLNVLVGENLEETQLPIKQFQKIEHTPDYYGNTDVYSQFNTDLYKMRVA